MFVYEQTLDILKLKKEKDTDCSLSCKSKGIYTSKRKPLYIALVYSIKLSEYKVGIKFDKDPLAVEQNNYSTKTVKVKIVYWPTNPLNNLELKNCLFGVTNIVKDNDKEK